MSHILLNILNGKEILERTITKLKVYIVSINDGYAALHNVMSTV